MGSALRRTLSIGFLLAAAAIGLAAAALARDGEPPEQLAAFQRPRVPADAFPASLSPHLAFDVDQSRLVYRGDSRPTLFLVPRRDGREYCIVAIDQTESGGFLCSEAREFVDGRGFNVLVLRSRSDRGRAPAHAIVGVAAANIAAIDLDLGPTTVRAQPSADGGFAVDVPERRGGPVVAVARDSHGTDVGRLVVPMEGDG